ncbi:MULTISPECIES: ABC transporter ATP-binding protein [unclassified Vibrio]|uniref:ABC transporter ATP-binding protein n=1 Tax=unclassified Vibrio TaxID=2614977 RepID=UPI0014934D79|nr:ABC transporter ATP-binding protein [Vibrio sp. AIC-3]NOH91672.1 ABC transporter ATP-binding protein [Vibrio sp. AIC-3]
MTIDKAIELKNVSVIYKERTSLFSYDQHTALKDITFDVFKGETLGIIGRNGAGKSTLLRILAGIIKPDGGNIHINTQSVSLMALQAGFDPNLSGRQNTIISGMLLGHRLSHIKNLIDDIKEYSELKEFYEKPIKNYSSGMLARLGFSIAMYTTPEVLLIDEVLGVGDVTFAEKAQSSIKEKIKSNTTVIIVSHDEAQLRLLSDRLVCIEDGVVIAEGSSDSVYIKYNMMMKLTSYGLEFNKYENPYIVDLKIGDVNLSKEYADVQFFLEGMKSLLFRSSLDDSQVSHLVIEESRVWMRIYYNVEYILAIDDNFNQAITFSIRTI